MTTQKIAKLVTKYLNEDNTTVTELYTEIYDENLGNTHNSVSGLIDEVVEVIEEEGYESDEYGDYPTLKETALYEIYDQIK